MASLIFVDSENADDGPRVAPKMPTMAQECLRPKPKMPTVPQAYDADDGPRVT